jgi:hypothetical protein
MYFYVLLYYCHRANTQLQLNKYIYIFKCAQQFHLYRNSYFAYAGCVGMPFLLRIAVLCCFSE